jgi:hypothetical protein
VVAVEDLPENIRTAVYPTVLHDLTEGPVIKPSQYWVGHPQSRGCHFTSPGVA